MLTRDVPLEINITVVQDQRKEWWSLRSVHISKASIQQVATFSPVSENNLGPLNSMITPTFLS